MMEKAKNSGMKFLNSAIRYAIELVVFCIVVVITCMAVRSAGLIAISTKDIVTLAQFAVVSLVITKFIKWALLKIKVLKEFIDSF